jgi:hypothetical protein
MDPCAEIAAFSLYHQTQMPWQLGVAFDPGELFKGVLISGQE